MKNFEEAENPPNYTQSTVHTIGDLKKSTHEIIVPVFFE